MTFAQVGSKIVTIAVTAWTWLANGAHTAYNFVLGLGAAAQTGYAAGLGATATATEGVTGATVAAEASVGAFLATVGEAALAIGALYANYRAFIALKSVSGGWEGMKAGIGGVLNGEGYFKGVDDYQNEQARGAAIDPR